jgi:hypothetical protein
MITEALSDVTPVGTVEELAAFLGVDDNDPLLSGLLISATNAVIDYLNLELVNRQRKVIYEHLPIIGTNTAPSLSDNNFFFENPVKLPYSGLKTTLDKLLLFGVDLTNESEIKQGRPSKVCFPMRYIVSNKNTLEITYTTGFGTVDKVPSDIKNSVIALAGFLYDSRGACSSHADALTGSGVASALSRWQVYKELL